MTDDETYLTPEYEEGAEAYVPVSFPMECHTCPCSQSSAGHLLHPMWTRDCTWNHWTSSHWVCSAVGHWDQEWRGEVAGPPPARWEETVIRYAVQNTQNLAWNTQDTAWYSMTHTGYGMIQHETHRIQYETHRIHRNTAWNTQDTVLITQNKASKTVKLWTTQNTTWNTQNTTWNTQTYV